MLGVLVVVLGRDPITCLEFSLGQSHVPIIASSRVVRTLWRRSRGGRCERPANGLFWCRFMFLFRPWCMAYPLMEMKRSKLRSKDCRPVIRPRSSSMKNACLLEDKTRKTACNVRSWLYVREESKVTCQVPASPLPLVRCPINHSTITIPPRGCALVASPPTPRSWLGFRRQGVGL